MLFAPFVADYIKEDRNDQLFEEDHGAGETKERLGDNREETKKKGISR